MLGDAKSEVWLSTFTFVDPKDRLCDMLVALRARPRRVSVHLVVSTKQAGKRVRQMDLLERAGVLVYDGQRTHSKLTVVDRRDVLVCSANLSPNYREAGLRMRSETLANEIVRYLRSFATLRDGP